MYERGHCVTGRVSLYVWAEPEGRAIQPAHYFPCIFWNMAMVMDYAHARQNMIDCQIRPNGVIDAALLDAMGSIPRELFVPAGRKGLAYLDEDLAIGGGRYLLDPTVTARLLQALDLRPGDVVLEIGSGTGYVTSVLAKLVNTVVAIEEDEGLAAKAQEVIQQLGIDNTVTISRKLTEGYAEQAPFDAILINGAVAEVPEALIAQLGDEGRLATVVRRPRELGPALGG